MANLAAASAPVRARTANAIQFIQIGLILALVIPLYSFVLTDLAHDWWHEPNLTYGLLIPPLAAYVVWLGRERTLKLPLEPCWRGLWLIGFACLIFLVGKLGAEFFLPRVSMVLLLAGLVWTFWGERRLRTLAFPFALLATAIPLPTLVYNSIAAPLQLLASNLATNAAQFCGVSAYRDGNVIQLANITLGIEEACSGLNSLSALMVASVLLGFLRSARPLTRVVLFLSSIPLSIGINILRVTGTAILADHDERFALGFYHSFSGWLVFMGGFAALYGISTLFNLIMERKA